MPIFAMFGARVVNFAAGTSELEMPWRRDLTYDGTAIPATVTGALIDFAGGSAAATLLPPGWG
ncbi:MAG: PaaI family thioesterase, partial [Alphaproteobacteria bacterium]